MGMKIKTTATTTMTTNQIVLLKNQLTATMNAQTNQTVTNPKNLKLLLPPSSSSPTPPPPAPENPSQNQKLKNRTARKIQTVLLVKNQNLNPKNQTVTKKNQNQWLPPLAQPRKNLILNQNR